MKSILLVVSLWFSGLQLSYGQYDGLPNTPSSAIKDFMDKRFGLFFHFGPVTLRGTEIGWSRNREVKQEDYDSLYKEFNPALFNANDWVKAAKDAGMKYLCITAKHHDGFLLWPSKISSYNISNTPFKRDIVGELAAACKKQGIKFCIYFTVLDWHDPDYPIHNPWDTTRIEKGNMERFVSTMKLELKELITNYHPYMLWFDGNWEKVWKEEYAIEVYKYIKSLDPNVVINNRLTNSNDHANRTSPIGDYLTPEQVIGKLNMKEPWESCITIGTQWAWKPNDQLKSRKECLQTLVKTAGGNGNLLLNVGPMMDGRIEARQVDLLKQTGGWLKKYGESIYATRGGPYEATNVYATTRKGNKIYVHVIDQAQRTITLPALPGVKINKAYFLKGENISFDQQENISIILPQTFPDPDISVIVLETSLNTEDIPVIQNK